MLVTQRLTEVHLIGRGPSLRPLSTDLKVFLDDVCGAPTRPSSSTLTPGYAPPTSAESSPESGRGSRRPTRPGLGPSRRGGPARVFLLRRTACAGESRNPCGRLYDGAPQNRVEKSGSDFGED